MDFRYDELKNASDWVFRHFESLGKRRGDPALPKEWRRHALAVASDVSGLADDLGLQDRERELVAFMGLVHEVGALVLPEDSGESASKPELTHRILESSGLLEDLRQEDAELIEAVMLYHDTPSLPGTLSPRALFFCQLVRDANQLDEWSCALPRFADYPFSGALSTQAVAELLSGSAPKRVERHHREDAVLAELGRVLLFHFAVSLRQVLGRELIERSCDELTADPLVTVIREHLCTYVRNRIAADSVTPRRS
ncbi:MAG: hypothetical protein MUC50_08970 [Myxococcota bacterium]|jgi:hypothetical protein|nr:hypothetical protein [Myxococcota bacterium]